MGKFKEQGRQQQFFEFNRQMIEFLPKIRKIAFRAGNKQGIQLFSPEAIVSKTLSAI